MSEKTLNTLVKIHKQQTDSLRREMVAIETQINELQELSARLQAEHKKEMEMVINDPAYSGFFGAYSANVKQRLEKISDEVKRLDTVVEVKRIAITQEFSEQKKYEIAQNNIKKQMQEEEKLAAQQAFDEIAIQRYANSEES